MKGIYHHGQFFGFSGANAFFDGAGMRPVRDSRRMQRDHAPGYVLTAHEIAIYIIQYLIAVDITMVVRSRNSLGMNNQTGAGKTNKPRNCGLQRFDAPVAAGVHAR